MSLNIPLYQNWKIRSDRYNYMIIRTQGDREFVEGYYSTLQGAIQGFIELKLREFDSTSLFGLDQSIKALQTALNKALQPFNIEVVASNSDKGEEVK